MNAYTIYRNPRDYPGQYVARRWVVYEDRIEPDHEPLEVSPELYVVRQAIFAVTPDVICLRRSPNDDPAVYETWI